MNIAEFHCFWGYVRPPLLQPSSLSGSAVGPCCLAVGPCGPAVGPYYCPAVGPCGPEVGPYCPAVDPCGPTVGPFCPALGAGHSLLFRGGLT